MISLRALRGLRNGDQQGLLHWMLPLMLALIAVATLLSGRDFSLPWSDSDVVVRHPAVAWIQRGVSLLLLLIAGERIAHHLVSGRSMPAPVLTLAFIAYWAASVAAPSLFGAHPRISHEYAYALLLGVAALLAGQSERVHVVEAARDALLLFLLASIGVAAVAPNLALDTQYPRGLLPGVPRFAGLAPHAVTLGMLAQTFLLCLWARPYGRPALNWAAVAIGLGVVFLAQAKNAWIALMVCSILMLAVRHGEAMWRRIADPRNPSAGILWCGAIIVGVLGVLGPLLVADLGSRAADFLDSPEGASLLTLTGRDRIWAIALEEWRASPVFGHGPGIWDEEFRASINMPNATSGHNQLMDTLSRSGLVGAIALVVYAAVLLFLSVRAARATGGLSLALGVALALRSMTEVPMLLFGYGVELFMHLLLIVTLASASAQTTAVPGSLRQAGYRATS